MKYGKHQENEAVYKKNNNNTTYVHILKDMCVKKIIK